MEVVLSHADGPWRCEISLRIMYDIAGKSLREPKSVGFGGALSDPKDVEVALRRAQTAVLRLPSVTDRDIGELLQDESISSGTCSGFSRNVIRLDVSGTELVDVTFIDLPGIITNSNKVRFMICSVNL
jgi:hypothetical protein